MIAHVVLFTPRPSLTPAERRALVADLEQACRDIPQIRRSRIGRRQRLGYAYDQAGPVHFEFLAVLEFDSREDLNDYLQHPSHTALGRWFHQGADLAIAHDFEMVDAEGLRGIVTDYTEG